MDDKYKLISGIDERLQAGEAALAGAYAALGKYAVEKAQDKFTDGKIRDVLDQAAEMVSTIENTGKMGRRIQEAAQKLEDIRDNLRFIENENGKLEEENLPAYEEFGRISAEKPGIEGLSPEAEEIRQKIHDLQRQAAETQEKAAGLREAAREKPFLSKMLGTGKAMILGSSGSFRLRKLNKLHQSFGSLLLQSMEDIPPGAYLNAYRANRKKLRENAAQAEKLAAERTALEDELRELGVEKRYQKRVKDLEIQNEKNAVRHRELLRLAGQELYEKHAGFDEGKAADMVCDIENCIQKNAEYAKEKKRLEAAIEYDNLTRKIHDLREKLENEEAAASAHKANTEKIKEHIAEAEKERSRAEKQRQGK